MVLYLQPRSTQSSRSLGFDSFTTETLRRHLFCYSAIDVSAVLVVAVRSVNTQLLSESLGVRAIPVGIPFCTSGNVDSKGQAYSQGGHGDSRRDGPRGAAHSTT